MARMLTAIVSDLHIGLAAGGDVARLPEVRDRLVAAVAEAECLVLLGDVLELRERPLATVLRLARPVFEELGRVMTDRRVVVVPGNHDHQLADPWITRGRLAGSELDTEAEWPVRAGDGLAGRLAEWMPRTEVTVAYPGLRLRPDVYATHGHYLDVRLRVPRPESIAASVMARVNGPAGGCTTPAHYEAVVEPLYSFFYSMVQGTTGAPVYSASPVTRTVWSRVNGGGGRLSRLLLGRVALPAGVAVLNRAGVGPFDSDVSAAALLRAGLRAMGDVVDSLGVEADHVVFGHTHRPGPLGGESGDWRLPSGTRLWNSGSWVYEWAFVRNVGPSSPYWPGTVIVLRDEGPPEVTNVLADVELRAAG